MPAAILDVVGRRGAGWIWRCHIDTSEPNPQVWSFLRPFLAAYDAAIFTMPQFVPRDFPMARVEIIAPAIDPLSPKNIDLGEATTRQIIEWIGVDPSMGSAVTGAANRQDEPSHVHVSSVTD